MNVATTIQKTAGAARDTLIETADDLVTRGERALHTAEHKAEDIRDAAMQEVTALVTLLNEKIKAIGINTEALADTAKDKAVSIEKSIVRELSEHPLRSLAYVALAGLAIGILTRK